MLWSSLSTSKPSRTALPKGRISAASPLPPPKRFQSCVAKPEAWSSLLKAVAALAPPRLSRTFLPSDWQVLMSFSRVGQLRRLEAPAACIAADGPPHAVLRFRPGYPAAPKKVVRKARMTMSTLESWHIWARVVWLVAGDWP